MTTNILERHVWCPGNGTRYDLYHGETNDNPSKIFISWMRHGGSGGYSFAFTRDTFLHYSYIMEKMQLNEADAAGILSFISKILFVKVGMPPSYNKDGIYSPSTNSWSGNTV